MYVASELKAEEGGRTALLGLPRTCLVCGKPVLGCSFEDLCLESLLCAVHYYAAHDSEIFHGLEGGPLEREVQRERKRIAEWRGEVNHWYLERGLPVQIA